MDREQSIDWQAVVHEVAKSQKRLSDFHYLFFFFPLSFLERQKVGLSITFLVNFF